MFGWAGKILRVNLSTETVSHLPTDRYARKYLGGRGIASRIYWEEVPPSVPALSAENKLIFMTGPLTGTIAPTSARTSLVGKAQMTPRDHYLCSNAGGHWGPALKLAGYDGLIVEGRASHPVLLWIEDNRIQFHSAEHLWGLDTLATQQRIEEERGAQTRVACIGPAGENGSKVAIILTGDGDAWGHGGFGGVMGWKNLKAIAIRGSRGVKVAQPQRLLEEVALAHRLTTCRQGEPLPPAPHRGQSLRYFPEKTNFPIPPGTTFLLDEEARQGSLRMGLTACGSCPVACAVSLAFADGSIPPGSVRCSDFGGWAISESLFSKRKELWGRVAHEASRTCDLLGINVYEFCDKWFLQAIQTGILTEADTGLPLAQYGSRQFWQTLLPLVASNQGVGARLARGGADFLLRLAEDAPEEETREAARRLYESNWNKDGTINYMAEGGQFEPEYASVLHVVLDGLGETGHRAMAYQTYNPALYHTAPLFPYGTPEFFQLRDQVAEKMWGVEHLDPQSTWSLRFVEWCLNEDILCNSLELCAWTFPLLYSAYTEDHQGDPSLPARLLSAVTGWEITIDELHRTVAPRIAALERMIRCREGRTAEDDIFQAEVFNLPWVQGWLTKEKARAFMSDFYATRGWQRDSGIPEQATLERLGLEDTIVALEGFVGGKAQSGAKE
ncbi:MAG: hypothetical protein NTV14_05635 [Coprothermobacterota bacterium]|nr:hypothetical protein [Coprothermobacterota bacterium]